MKQTISCLGLVFLFAFSVKSNTLEEYRIASDILDRLFEKSGFHHSRKPELIISEKSEKVAAYYPYRNQILFETKAYDVCRSMGKDSLAGIAFLLGHELAHAFQTDLKHATESTNFLSYDRHYDGGIRTEKTADIQGAFNAYLAGYEVLSLVPELLEKLYVAYDLKGVTLSGYPSLSERKATGAEVGKIVQNLIDLYENAGYLIALGEYAVAKDCYEYILRYYQGREIYNNLGVFYALEALQYIDIKTDQYIHPLRLDASMMLQIPPDTRGGSLGPYKRKIRNRLLKGAENNFETALKLDPDFEIAKINLFSVFNLSGRQEKTIQYYANSFKKGYSSEADMALALAFLTQGEKKGAAVELLNNVILSKDIILKNQARFNLKRALNPEAPLDPAKPLPLPRAVSDLIFGIELGENIPHEVIYLSEESDTYFQKSGTGTTMVYSFEKPQELTNAFKKIKLRGAGKLALFEPNAQLKNLYYKNILPLDSGFYWLDLKKQFILKINKRGRLEEVVRIFRY